MIFIQENNIHVTRYTLFEFEDLNESFELINYARSAQPGPIL